MTRPDTIDFAHAVPPPLNTLILELAGAVAWLRWLLDVVTWKKGHRVESWLFLASWWAFCILGPFAIKYALPTFFVLPSILVVSPKKTKSNSELSTEDTFQETVSNLLAVQSTLKRPSFKLPSIPPTALLRVLGTILPPYWIIGRLLGAQVIVAILGTIVFCWQANWANKLSEILWESAWFRISVAYTWSFVTGQPRPSTPLNTKTLTQATKNSTTELRLIFTIFENQRWWMGLDWTAALLPAERPSWSTSNLQPVSPPTSFTLPEVTTAYVPHPEKNNFRIQRRASWRWEEMEWKVVINRNDTGSPPSRPRKTLKPLTSSPVDLPIPESGKDAITYDSTNRLRERLKEKMGASNTMINADHNEAHEEEENHSQLDDGTGKLLQYGSKVLTDAEGWIYGDNKWENTADKGGMGKYTRFRRWTRIAVLREETEEVGPGSTGVVRSRPAQTIVSIDIPSPTNPSKGTTSPLPSPTKHDITASGRLRQRLQAAMRRDSISS